MNQYVNDKNFTNKFVFYKFFVILIKNSKKFLFKILKY